MRVQAKELCAQLAAHTGAVQQPDGFPGVLPFNIIAEPLPEADDTETPASTSGNAAAGVLDAGSSEAAADVASLQA